MSKQGNTVIGILSFLPAFLMIFFVGFTMRFVFGTIARGNEQDLEFNDVFSQLWPVVLGGILLALLKLGLMIYFIVHAINNPAVQSSERVVWILVFILAGTVGFPIYYFMRMRNRPTAVETVTTGAG